MLGALLVIAFALRAWLPSHMSIEHFDEGVYASNYFSSHLDFRYPDRHLYAPPLFPAILEWTLILSGGNPHAVMWVNVVLGTALVAAIWWVAKLIAGGGAALAAAALATFSDFLIQYSRVALTDTPVCLFMVLAVGFGLIALRDRNSLAAVGATLLTAAAWWTKYNGWLPLAILGAGLAGWVVFERPKRSEALPRIGLFVVIAVGAFLFWLPCLWGLQEFGGYAAVAKNHAGYVVGFNGWWDSLVRHLQVQREYSIFTMAGIVVALLVSHGLLTVGKRKGDSGFWCFMLILSIPLVFMSTLLPGQTIALFLVSGISLITCYVCSKTSQEDSTRRLGWWMLLAWILGLLVSTPVYRPYPRLFMPLMIAIVIASGMGFELIARRLSNRKTPASNSFKIITCMVLAWFVLEVFAGIPWFPEYQDRNQFQKITSSVIKNIREIAGTSKQLDDLNAIIYVVGEPGLCYHLASREQFDFDYITQPASNLGMLSPKSNAPNVPTFLILGPHASQEMETLAIQNNQAKLIKEFEYLPSDFVLLDDHAPAKIEENREAVVQLWQVLQR